MKLTTIKYTASFSDIKLSLKDLALKSRSTLSNIQNSCPKLIDDACQLTVMAETRLMPCIVNLPTAVIDIDGKAFYVGKKIAQKLRNASYCVVFVCTAGDELFNIAQQSNKQSDYLKGYYYDLFANMLVEKSVDWLSKEMKQEHEIEHLSHSNKYGPGYCDWPLVDQRELLSLLENDHINISLSESGLMLPIKSLSGIWGVGEQVKFLKDTCQSCSSKPCLYRKNLLSE